MAAELRAGAARRIITPPKNIFLIGYGDRSKGNQGVHDDLTATALLLDDGQTRLAILALDILAINEFIVDRLRSQLEAGTEVLLCCSHTHSGPIAYADKKSSRLNRAYIDSLVDNLAQAVNTAASQLTPARLEWFAGEADIAINRRQRQPDGRMEIGRNPDGPVDRSVQGISVFSLASGRSAGVTSEAQSASLQPAGVRIATLVNFACHGTVLGPANLLVSADWIGAMRSKVEEQLGGLALFLQGATGNLNPDMEWEDDVRAFEKVREQGERVAQAVIHASAQNSERIDPLPLAIERSEAILPLEAPAAGARPPKNYARPLLAMAHLPGWLAFLADPLLNQRYPWKPRLQIYNGAWAVPMRVNAVRIGDLALITFGAEVFTEIGMKARRQSPAPHTLFASLTDGCISYLHTAEAHAEGGYEVEVAPLAYRYPGRLAVECEQIALDSAAHLTNKLWARE